MALGWTPEHPERRPNDHTTEWRPNRRWDLKAEEEYKDERKKNMWPALMTQLLTNQPSFATEFQSTM